MALSYIGPLLVTRSSLAHVDGCRGCEAVGLEPGVVGVDRGARAGIRVKDLGDLGIGEPRKVLLGPGRQVGLRIDSGVREEGAFVSIVLRAGEPGVFSGAGARGPKLEHVNKTYADEHPLPVHLFLVQQDAGKPGDV